MENDRNEENAARLQQRLKERQQIKERNKKKMEDMEYKMDLINEEKDNDKNSNDNNRTI